MATEHNAQRVEERIRSIVEGEGSAWGDRGFFVVGIACREGNPGGAIDEITVTVDCDGLADDGSMRGVGIDDCAALSREISARLEEMRLPELEDFSLTVMSAGLGQPIVLERQYRKLMQRALMRDALPQVDVLFKDGRKLAGAILTGVGYDNAAVDGDVPGMIEVAYTVRELLPGKKRKTEVERREQIALADVKSVSEHFSFK